MSHLISINGLSSVSQHTFFPWLAGVYNEPYDGITLYTTGCSINGQINCAIACQKPHTVWQSAETLNNCLAYPAVSLLLGNGDLDEAGTKTAHQLGILPNLEHVTSIVDSINGCTQEYCGTLAKDDPWRKPCLNNTFVPFTDPLIPGNVVSQNSGNIYEFASTICGSYQPKANMDIAGVGIYASYLMQLSIVLLAWLYSTFLTTWARAVAFVTSLPTGVNAAKKRVSSIQQQIHKTEQYSRLVSGLIEYQKAQAYFGITMQGAAMLALSGNGSIFEAITYEEIGLAVAMLGDVASTGIVCLTLGLYLLQKAKKTSLYVTSLSILAATLSFITWTQTRTPLSNLEPQNNADVYLESCGGFRTPAKFCTASTTIDYSTKFEGPIITCCIVVLLLLIIRQGSEVLVAPFEKARSLLLKRKADHLFDTERHYVNKMHKLRKILKINSDMMLHTAAEIVLVLSAIIMLVWLAHPTSLGFPWGYRKSTHNGQWTFGQLIAITIWAPSIIEYIHSAFRGVEEAHEHRYTFPYKLVKDESSIAVPTLQRAGTFYQRLDSHSDLELPLAHSHSSRTSFELV